MNDLIKEGIENMMKAQANLVAKREIIEKPIVLSPTQIIS